MDEKEPIPTEPLSTEPEIPTVSRSISPGAGGARSGGPAKLGQARQTRTEPQRVEIVLRVTPAEPQQSEPTKPAAEVVPEPDSIPVTVPEPAAIGPTVEAKVERREGEPQQIPARMLNEFVYCQRLFYYEFVEGVFVESADTLRGEAIHQRVDTGTGALPEAAAGGKGKSKVQGPSSSVKSTSEDKRSKVQGGVAVPAASGSET